MIGITASLGSVFCQTDANDTTSQIAERYDDFFRQISAIKAAVPSSSVSREPNGHLLRLRDQIGISESDARLVTATAIDYIEKLSRLGFAARRLKHEAVFQNIESGRVSDQLARKIADLETRRTELLAQQIAHLRAALSSSSFALVESFVRSDSSLLPRSPVPARKAAPPN